MLSCSLAYYNALNHALKASTTLSRNELELLHTLYSLRHAHSYSALYALIGDCMSSQTFYTCIHNLEHRALIKREPRDNYVMHSITAKGISVLHNLSIAIEREVQHYIQLYGNGL